MLSQTAEYALRAVAALAPSAGKLIPTTDLAKLADVPPPYLAKVLQQLAAADIIRGRRGVGGGYTLNRAPSDINLLEVVLAVGPLRQPKTEQEIEQIGDGLNSLHSLIDSSVAQLRDRLESTSVSDVAQEVVEIKPEVSQTSAPAAEQQTHHVLKRSLHPNGSRNGSTNGSMAGSGY